MTKVLEKDYNIIPLQTELLIRPIRLEKKVQKHLGLPRGTPGLFIRRKKSTQHGEIVEIDNEYWRHDAIEIKVETPFLLNAEFKSASL